MLCRRKLNNTRANHRQLPVIATPVRRQEDIITLLSGRYFCEPIKICSGQIFKRNYRKLFRVRFVVIGLLANIDYCLTKCLWYRLANCGNMLLVSDWLNYGNWAHWMMVNNSLCVMIEFFNVGNPSEIVVFVK